MNLPRPADRPGISPTEPPDPPLRLTYPCWLLVHEGSITYPQGGGPELAEEIVFVTVTDGAGRRALPVFTGLVPVSRFADGEDGLGPAVVASASGREQLRDLLERIAGDGLAESVVLDPSDPFDRARRAWPIGSVIQQLAEGVGEGSRPPDLPVRQSAPGRQGR